jgi:hypothetical protein
MTAQLSDTPDLNNIEALVDAVSEALVAGDVLELTAASAALRDAVAALAGLAGISRGKPGAARMLDPALRERMEKLSQQMARQREGVHRRAVVVDRALSAVLPGEDETTYSNKVLADRKRSSPARIYTAMAT